MTRQSACLVFNPIKVNNYNASLFKCTPVGRASDYDGHDLKLFILVVRWTLFSWAFFACCLANWGSTFDSLLLQNFSDVV